MKWYRRMGLLATALATCVLVAGCGGITASPSISPATFFMPGLVKDAPGADGSEFAEEPAPVREVASAR